MPAQSSFDNANCAGVPHLEGWGCEPGAGCCSAGAMIAGDETPSTGTCGLQDPVSFGVGDTVSTENPRARDSGISQEGPPGSAGISPGLVSGGDWSGTGPCPSAHGDSAEVRGIKGGGDFEKRHQSAAEREISARVAQSVLGWWRDLARGFFASTVGINEATIRQYVRHQGEQETGQAQLEL